MALENGTENHCSEAHLRIPKIKHMIACDKSILVGHQRTWLNKFWHEIGSEQIDWNHQSHIHWGLSLVSTVHIHEWKDENITVIILAILLFSVAYQPYRYEVGMYFS